MGAMPKRQLIFLTGVLVLGSLLVAANLAGAQTMTIETVPPEVDETGRTARERVDEVVLALRILAAVVLVGTAAFWWHTRPIKTLKERDSMDQKEPTSQDSST